MPNSFRAFVLALPLAALLTGCSLENTAQPSPVPGTAISGVAFGGQQTIGGSKVYLLAANPAGYGSPSLSLLTTASTSHAVDSIGSYALTAVLNGGFNLAGDYSCTKGYALGASTASGGTTLSGSEQVYLYILGGNSGAGTNSSIGLLAALGPCNAIYSTKLTVNEVTTIAAAYAFSGFATDATHVSSSSTALALNGLANAGLNSLNLADIETGLPTASTSGVTRPVSTLFTLANILAACVDSSSSSSACNTLFQYTSSAGTSGTAATDTATAAINLAHNPWPSSTGMTDLYGLVPGTAAPYPGSLPTQPNDFTLGLNYTGGGLSIPDGLAIDGSGNAWIANNAGNSVTELSSTGAALSTSSGYSLGGTTYTANPQGVAIDASNHVWVANFGSSIYELSSTGALISPASGFYGGGLNEPADLAIDASGNVWAANTGNNSLSEFNSSGVHVSTSSGFTGAGLNQPFAIAIDASGHIWAANFMGDSLSEFSATGSAIGNDTGGGLSRPLGLAFDASGNAWVANAGNYDVSKFSSSGTALTSASGYTGGGLYGPFGIAIDGSGNVWAANYGAGTGTVSVSELSSSGSAISPSTGYTGGGLDVPQALAIDGSGDVWATNFDGTNSSVTELIGAATPVVTPLAASLRSPYSATAAKP